MTPTPFLLTLFITFSALCPLSVHSQSPGPPSVLPSPAPAPAPEPANLTHLLSFAGPFSSFLRLLRSADLLDPLQARANDSRSGLTMFAPTDAAFASLKPGAVEGLNGTQLRQLLSVHVLPDYYSLADFRNLSSLGPASTLAGGTPYTLTFSDDSGVVRISTGLDDAKLSSSVWTTSPVALYSIDKVLLPRAIFGDSEVFAPAPAPAPAAQTLTPDSDSPAARPDRASSPESSDSPPFSGAPAALVCGTQLVMVMVVVAVASFI